jgi:ubiquinone/menaquinone biosynthesis C-methylase UbiE
MLLFSSLRLRSSENIYNHFAKHYEDLFGPSQGEAARLMLEYLREQPMVQRTALDLGCGTGILTRGLADHVEKVVGVDSSEEMLRRARGHGEGGEIEYVKMDVTSIDHLGERYDLVTALGLLPHIPRGRFSAWLLEVLDVVSEHGQLLIGIPSPPWRLLAGGDKGRRHTKCDEMLGNWAGIVMAIFRVDVDFWYLKERHISMPLEMRKLNYRVSRKPGLTIIDIRRDEGVTLMRQGSISR